MKVLEPVLRQRDAIRTVINRDPSALEHSVQTILSGLDQEPHSSSYARGIR